MRTFFILVFTFLAFIVISFAFFRVNWNWGPTMMTLGLVLYLAVQVGISIWVMSFVAINALERLRRTQPVVEGFNSGSE